MSLFIVRQNSKLFLLYELFSILVRMAVPIFLTISGGLLISREETAGGVLRRMLRHVCVLILFSAIYYLYNHFIQGNICSWSHFVKTLYSGNITGPYWYLYYYLGFLLMIPFIRVIAKAMSNKQFLYCFGLYVGFYGIKIIEYFVFQGKVSYNINIEPNILRWNFIYPMLGYYLEDRVDTQKISKKEGIGLCIMALTAMLLTCFLTNYRCRALNSWSSYTYFYDNLLLIPVAVIYLLAKSAGGLISWNKTITSLLTKVGSCTFGIYLLERMTRKATINVFYVLDEWLPTFVATSIWVGFAFFVGLLITFILKKLPLLRRLL